jgi:hypothetical protein
MSPTALIPFLLTVVSSVVSSVVAISVVAAVEFSAVTTQHCH